MQPGCCLRSPPQMNDPKALLLYGAVAVVTLAVLQKATKNREEAKIPIVHGESTGLFANYKDAFKFLSHASDLIQHGYDLYPNGVFRVSRFYYWQYVVCGTKLVKEVGNVSEEVLSFQAGVEETTQLRLTMGHELVDNRFHLNVVRTTLTRNLHARFPDVRDEIVGSFKDVFNVEGSEWKLFHVRPTIMDIVARVSNRLFIGLPLCRNKEYLDNNVAYTIGVMTSANKISLLPKFLRPIIGPFLTEKKRSFATAMRLLGPLVTERIQKEDALGPDWDGKPNDLISWLLEMAPSDSRTVAGIVQRILVVNMAAIHTSSMAFSHTLYTLAAHPREQYFLPMREEAERVVAEEGWSKAALNSMHKIDSFLRESQRLNGIGPVVMNRRVVSKEGLRLSDGTFLPYGAYVCAASKPAHYDPANYDNPDQFDGFRFAKEREAQLAREDFDSNKHVFGKQMITTAPEHLAFGTGKHACPGRFFAATELKAMLAHLVLEYDIKAEVEGYRPTDEVFGIRASPNSKGKVFLRKRQD
ncbi:cytochrome P450 [Mycena amicta]|nr:cytochrome P450 [Mycena amicta]